MKTDEDRMTHIANMRRVIELRGMDKTIVFKKDGKEFGRLYGTTFRKRVKMSRHLFRKSDAWAIDAELLKKYLVPIHATIEIFDEENLKLYCISAEDAMRFGMSFQFQDDIGDYRIQIFISRHFFQIKTTDEHGAPN